MTDRLAEQVRHALPADWGLETTTARFGSEVIASRASFAVAAHAALDAYRATSPGIGAVLLACFGDPGLAALREVASVPVLGLLESAVQAACRHGPRFGVVTLGPAWAPMLFEGLLLLGHPQPEDAVVALPFDGLHFQRDPDAALDHIQAAVKRAADAGVSSVILGGSVLAGFGPRLQSSVPLVDPLQAALQSLTELG